MFWHECFGLVERAAWGGAICAALLGECYDMSVFCRVYSNYLYIIVIDFLFIADLLLYLHTLRYYFA